MWWTRTTFKLFLHSLTKNMVSSSSSFSPSNVQMVWLFICMFLISLLAIPTVQTSATTGQQNSLQENNQLPTLAPSNNQATVFQNLVDISPRMSTKEAFEAIKLDLQILQQEVKSLRTQQATAQHTLDQLQSATYLDGSSAMHAVFDNLITTGTNRVKLCEWKSCQFQPLQDGVKSLLEYKHISSEEPAVQIVFNCSTAPHRFDSNFFAENLILVGDCNNNSQQIMPISKALDAVRDRTLAALYIDENEQEATHPILQQVLNAWIRKVKVSGVVLGHGYRSQVPFQQSKAATSNELAVKQALDLYRTGDDNVLGQDDSIWVGGSTLWYFTKIKASIFG